MDILLFAVSVSVLPLWKKLGDRNNNSKGANKDEAASLQAQLEAGTSLNASERICTVTAEDNIPIPGGHDRATMRLQGLWHRATYCLIRHEPQHLPSYAHEDMYILVQKRSSQKDYCPSKLDPTPGGVVGYNESYRDNILRELEEEMGITVDPSKLKNLFTFPYQDETVRVWGDFYEYIFVGKMSELTLQVEEVDAVYRRSLQELQEDMSLKPEDFMPDSTHAMKLYFQHSKDLSVQRRFLKGSSSDLTKFQLRPPIEAIFFDCDDCLYFDNWKTARKLTAKIEEWCLQHGLKPGQAYQLYKQYGTALRGLLAEGYIEDSPKAIKDYLEEVHDIGVETLIAPDLKLQKMLARLDPSIPRFIFTASVSQHAQKCLEALGIAKYFQDAPIIDCQACDLETKHSAHAFRKAMEIAGVTNPQACLFLDDSTTNIKAARHVGWRANLVGRVGRDSGQTISSEHAELELETIHDMEKVFPELFITE